MKYFDRVKETAATTGTGDFTLAGAATGFRTFASVLSTNDTCYYCIALQGGAEWEVGLGTYSAANTLTRTTVLSSSNAGSAVNFSAGTKDVFLSVAANEFKRPSFSAHKNAVDQTGVAGSWAVTKLTYTTENWDIEGCYDATNSKFTPNVAGYYMIKAVAQILNLASGSEAGLYVYKNNASWKRGPISGSVSSSGYMSVAADTIVYLNGSTDYIEIYITQSSGSTRTVLSAVDATWFQAMRVA